MESVIENNQESLKGKLKRAFKTVATHPAFSLSIGNTVMALATNNKAGAVVQAGMTAMVSATAFRAGWRNQPVHIPFYVVGAANIVTAAWGLYSNPLTQQANGHTVLDNK